MGKLVLNYSFTTTKNLQNLNQPCDRSKVPWSYTPVNFKLPCLLLLIQYFLTFTIFTVMFKLVEKQVHLRMYDNQRINSCSGKIFVLFTDSIKCFPNNCYSFLP